MTSIKQLIPNFLQGMSDQPDELKIPGQVRSLSNAFPDVTAGLMKRPGLKHLGDLGGQNGGKWFNIFCENVIGIEEQYVCNIQTDGQIFIWAAIDIYNGTQKVHSAGDPIDIVFDSTPDVARSYPQSDLPRIEAAPMATPPSTIKSYLAHKKFDDLQTLTVNNFTFITHRQKFPTMASNTASSRPNEAYISLKQIAYSRQYSVNIASPGGGASTETTATKVTLSVGSEPTGNKSCHGTFDEEVTFNSGSKRDLRVQLTNTCQIIPDGGDGYDSRYTHDIDLLFGGTGWVTGDTVTKTYNYYGEFNVPWTVRVADHSTTTVYDDIAAIRPDPTPSTGDTVLTGSAILGDVRNAINAISGFTATIIGDGIYITANRAFQITTTEGDLWNILSSTSDSDGRYSTINNVSNLPTECKHGYVVKVANSGSTDDDYYLKFFGNNNSDGVGVWEETAKPGIKTNFNYQTMPHQLVRGWNSANTRVTFELAPIYWNARNAGDDNTNPIPSFVRYGDRPGGPINKMLIYRNRLVMLSQDNIVLSQSGDLFNFFADTALTVTAADPIDINCSVNSSSVLYDGLVVNNGMVLFSKFNQFLFTTDADILSPNTAKSTLIASYDFNSESEPFNMASNVGFFSTAGNDSIFWEMRDIYREGPPNVEERSKIVSRSLPGDLNIIAASKEDGLIIAGKRESNELWCYRYFYSGDRQLQSAWFKWTMPGDVIHHFNNSRGQFWVVYRDGDQNRLVGLDLKDKLEAEAIDGRTWQYYVYLDNWTSVRPTYDPVTKLSTFVIPWTPTKAVKAYSLDTDDYRGRSTEPVMTGGTGRLPGNWSDADVAIGYEYEMEVQFPTLFVTAKQGQQYRADTSSSLTLHRVQMNFGTVGMYTVELDRYGKDDFSMTIETTEMDGYGANRVAGYLDKIYTIPVYDRNHNCNLTLRSSHPTPATLHSMTFEGDYTSMYYKSV